MSTGDGPWLVLNQASGSNDDDANRDLIERLGCAGMAPARVVDCAQDDLPTRSALKGAGVDLVVCHTGDGTLNALLTGLEDWAGAVLVLPGGTTNLLSKALHGDRTSAEIVADLDSMRRTRRTCIRSDAGTALIEVVAGPGATWSDVREGLREGDLTATATRAVEAARQSTSGPMVAVAEPALGRPDGYSGVRMVPEADGIVAAGYGAEGIGDYLKQGVALLRRDFREGPHDELGRHPELVCRSVDGSGIELMLDGERASGAAQIRFSLDSLRVDLLSGR
ncbi:diacylglycerol kinase family protein [Parablastomonas sp. CN1-191]|uniref:diacylglycerol kinase family protein n=1 Tax=Parablastomonas sp. CN1-191 TaxID=3400908 RepID=UPI003BF87C56